MSFTIGKSFVFEVYTSLVLLASFSLLLLLSRMLVQGTLQLLPCLFPFVQLTLVLAALSLFLH